jgi:hypothetical protein
MLNSVNHGLGQGIRQQGESLFRSHRNLTAALRPKPSVKASSPSPTLSTNCEPKPGNRSSALLGFDSAGIDSTASGSAPSAGRGKKKNRRELNDEAPRIFESAPRWPPFHSANTTADTQANCCSGTFDVEQRNFERNPPLRTENWGGEDAHRLKSPSECRPA